jgi:hypothetical protein
MRDEDRGATHVNAERTGARGGDARSVGDCCRSAQAAQSTSQPGAMHVRERQVASGLVGLRPFPTELGLVLFKWAYRSQRADPFTLFLLFISFPINSKAQVSKIQITFLLNSKNFQICQVFLDKFKTNKHPFWPNSQFSLDFEL